MIIRDIFVISRAIKNPIRFDPSSDLVETLQMRGQNILFQSYPSVIIKYSLYLEPCLGICELCMFKPYYSQAQSHISVTFTSFHFSWPRGYKPFSCSTQLSMKFFQLINVEMSTIVGISIFMSRKKPEKS